jgi:hypothetical protein
MSDASSGSPPPSGGASVPPSGAAQHRPFPGARLLFTIGFAFLAWCVFWAIIVLGLVQFVMVVINGETNAELKRFSKSLVQYLWQLLAYVTFITDDQPFPVGPFPSQS